MVEQSKNGVLKMWGTVVLAQLALISITCNLTLASSFKSTSLAQA